VNRRSATVAYLLVVGLAVAYVIGAGYTTTYASLARWDYVPENWRPTTPLIAILAVIVASLAVTPVWPAWSIAAYSLLEFSLPRYGPELTFVCARHLLPLTALVGFLGCKVHEMRTSVAAKPSQLLLVRLTAALAVWAMISTAAALWREAGLDVDIRQHPTRYIGGLLLCLSGVAALRKPADFLVIVFSFSGAVVWRTVREPDSLPLDGNASELCAIALPLLVSAALVTTRWPLRIGAGVLAANFLRLIVQIQNRAGAVGAVAAIVGFWMQSRRRWLFAVPVLLVLAIGGVLLSNTGLANRLRGSVPGGDTYGSVHERLSTWRSALFAAGDHPVFGVGPGRFAGMLNRYNELSSLSVHNTFLAALTELGLPGFVLYSMLVLAAIAAAWRSARTSAAPWPAAAARGVSAALVAYAAAGMFTTRQDQAQFFILVGMAAALSAGGAALDASNSNDEPNVDTPAIAQPPVSPPC
jgi:O-antigen ligase